MGAILLSEIDSPLTRTLPSQQAPEGFCFLERSLFRISRRKPERETRIPGLARGRARPRARGLPEGTRRKPDTDGRAGQQGPLWRRAVESAATEFVFQFGSPQRAAQRMLVVKMSDTSHHER